jgi:hypothetical protein
MICSKRFFLNFLFVIISFFLINFFFFPFLGYESASSVLTRSSQTSKKTEREELFRRKVNELLELKYRYHCLDLAELGKISSALDSLNAQGARSPLMMKRYGAEIDYEEHILSAMTKANPYIVADMKEADFVFVPLPIGTMLAMGRTSFAKKMFKGNSSLGPPGTDIFSLGFSRGLFRHPYFIEMGGNRHVLLSLVMPLFSNLKVGDVRELSRFYSALENVTIARHNDIKAVYNKVREPDYNAEEDDYSSEFLRTSTVTKSEFSIGLGVKESIPFIQASYDAFLSKKYFIFYRTRERGSVFNSTKYRKAPLRVNMENLPLSSIGLPLNEPKEWLSHYSSSKFCLNIRGDSPHSHSLLRAIKLGCIPVIISNWLIDYSSPFKSTLNMEDFSVMIDENKFMADPLHSLLELQNISEDIILDKIKALEFAQRVVLPLHNESLFIPAFVKESVLKMKEMPS